MKYTFLKNGVYISNIKNINYLKNQYNANYIIKINGDIIDFTKTKKAAIQIANNFIKDL